MDGKIYTNEKPNAVIKETSTNDSNSYDDYILPKSNLTRLSRQDITGLSKDQLWKARNEVYARHGRMFDNTDLQQYFSAKSWYYGAIAPEDFDESVLNQYEKANIDLIKTYEEDMESGAGATSDNSQQTSKVAEWSALKSNYCHKECADYEMWGTYDEYEEFGGAKMFRRTCADCGYFTACIVEWDNHGCNQ